MSNQTNIQTFKVWQPQRAARSKRPNTQGLCLFVCQMDGICRMTHTHRERELRREGEKPLLAYVKGLWHLLLWHIMKCNNNNNTLRE